MSKVPAIVPISDLRQDSAAVLERVRRTKEPVFITQRGRAAAVLLDVGAYEQAAREHEILRLLAQGEREIAAGAGHDLDEVLAEADRLLAK